MDSADPMSVLHGSLKKAPRGVTVLLTDGTTESGALLASDDHCNVLIRLPSGTCRFIRGALVRVVYG